MSQRLGGRPLRTGVALACVLTAGLAAAGCSAGNGAAQASSKTSAASATARSSAPDSTTTAVTPSTTASTSARRATSRPPAAPFRHPLSGMPRSRADQVYAASGPGDLLPRVARDPAYLYVPNSYGSPTTTVIDQRTHKIVRVLHTGELSQHVTPSWDLRTLYIEASAANELVALDPRTGRIERRIAQRRPYNLYFTPNGRRTIVMDEEDNEIAFDDPHSFKRRAVVHDPSCVGPNHADFSANGRFFVVTCEFSGSLLKVSTLHHRVLARLKLPPGSKPQDVRLSPDGRTFYVADMDRNRVLRLGWRSFRVVGHIDTPAMPHGIYPSRDGRFLYVSDRMAGKVSVISIARNKIVDTWSAPGSHPDMGGLSADGRTLWLSGRYDGHVYGWDTRTGKLVAKIYVGGSPHGLLVWPQPGRYSLGHTGNLR